MKTLKTYKLLTEEHCTDLHMLRKALQEELEAINLYEKLAGKAMRPKVRTLFKDLDYEEKIHANELEEMIEEIDPDWEFAEEEAEDEIEEMGK